MRTINPLGGPLLQFRAFISIKASWSPGPAGVD
jgi:hypothetical protein